MPETPKLNVSLEQTTAVTCEKCNGSIFVEGMLIRKVSKFLSGTVNDAVTPISVFACSKCGHVNNDFLPLALQSKTIES